LPHRVGCSNPTNSGEPCFGGSQRWIIRTWPAESSAVDENARQTGSYEDERLTEDDRDALPDQINALRGDKFGNWLSEREWIPVMLETADKPRRLQLKLDVNEANIDGLERQSCKEIFLARGREYQDSYRHPITPDNTLSVDGAYSSRDGWQDNAMTRREPLRCPSPWDRER
jgi:hypothetical protein